MIHENGPASGYCLTGAVYLFLFYRAVSSGGSTSWHTGA